MIVDLKRQSVARPCNRVIIGLKKE